jgi:hypothetical protein
MLLNFAGTNHKGHEGTQGGWGLRQSEMGTAGD